ncbi:MULTISPECIES: hypothetical protein [unclassified Bradyrhizobium]|uniref:hypothetical protein n=1 Tax=unclassified Bradyrhizobium TaxID=2631580 RepID=UPI0024486FDC|nr:MULTISPECIES: hypothetical protein [unclassified Bradyrhizobium]MDH2348792.1 hypothetical protein [Bradyrhizobium sp. SSUT77]MDH2352531.1 hypothetical protein [Bradyrhizobium sp. SSUT112]
MGIAAVSSGLGSSAAAQAPLGLLVASRPSSLRMAVALGTRNPRGPATDLSRLCKPCHVMEAIVRNTNQWLLAAVLAALLIAATWYCVGVWNAPSMPLYGNIIFGAVMILMLLSGCGLIAPMLYSRRKGYDEPARTNRTTRE